MAQIARRLAAVIARIRDAEQRFQRREGSVTLLAVSKTHPADHIAEAARAGQQRFGENYVQEAIRKQELLSGHNLEWHFIGPIQSNKTRRIALHFAWVHSVDRLEIAQRLSNQRPRELRPLNVCLQVNICGEPTKSGLLPHELAATAEAVAELPRLRLRGLMTIPAPEADFERQRQPFARLREARDTLITRGVLLDTLSMGMSDDIEAAIAEGSTLVRVGTAIFGPRRPRLSD